MLEWMPEHKWNSFNSNKALQYRAWYDAIQKGEFLPPIEVSIDPVNDCQLNCYFCNGRDVRHRQVRMTDKHLDDLLTFFKHWGVKGICFAGGGEPTMHESLWKAFYRLHLLKIPASIITNGLFLDDEQIKFVGMYSQWIGISVDCAHAETFKRMKGVDRFDETIENIRKILSVKPKEVTYKFLINSINQYEIYDAIKLAAELGCHSIHIRPVSYKNFQKKEEDYDLYSVNNQITKGFMDYGDKLRIFAVRHKFNEKMHVQFPFKKCMATPLMPIFQADGWMTACIDRKADNSLRLCRHDGENFNKDILKFWSSDRHKEILDKIKIEECPKCTIQHCNEIYEKVIVENRMNWEFV